MPLSVKRAIASSRRYLPTYLCHYLRLAQAARAYWFATHCGVHPPSNLTTDFSQIHTIDLNASKIYPKETLFYF